MSEQDFKKVVRNNDPQDLIEELVIIAEILQDSNAKLRKDNLKIPFLKKAIKELQRELNCTLKENHVSGTGDACEQFKTESKPLLFAAQFDDRIKNLEEKGFSKEIDIKNSNKL